MSRRTFETRRQATLPSWLWKGDGKLVWLILDLLQDALMQRMLLGVRAKYPSFAPPDALSVIGADRKKLRGVGETTDSYRQRLLGWLEQQSHPTRGGPLALCHEVRDYCGGDGIQVRLWDVRGNVYTVDRSGNESWKLDTGLWRWDPIPPSPQWARQWLAIYPAWNGTKFKPWGRPALLDGSWALDGSHMLGTDAAPSEIAALRQIVKDWTSAGRRTEWIIYYFQQQDSGGEPDAFDPETPPAPDGTWYLWSKPPDASENRRPPDAAYIKGGDTVTPYGAMIP